MNREQARKWFQSHMTSDTMVNEAYDMAIEALSTDAVDRPPRTVKLTEGIEITLDEEAYEIGYTHGQMADRPQGEWIMVTVPFITNHALAHSVVRKEVLMNTEYRCSVCGKTERTKYNFCPNCGAIMRGGAE